MLALERKPLLWTLREDHPRGRLAVELGAALRLGQVYLTRRSQVDMEALLFITDDPARWPRAWAS